MNRFKTIVAGACLSFLAAVPATADDFDRLADVVSSTENHSATFVQTFRPESSDQEIRESGSVVLGTLPKMKWTYDSPEKKIFIFDGVTSWLYVPLDQQVSVHRLTDAERDHLPFLLLKEETRARQRFRISTAREGGELKMTLSPRGESQIQSLVVSADPESKRINAIEWTDSEGNLTRFTFDEFRKIAPDETEFRFRAPAGVEVVEY